MSTEFSMISLMNAALRAQGQDVLVSENDGSLEWDTLFRNWPAIVEAEMETGRYNFTKSELTSVTRINGRFGKDDGYKIPLDVLHVRRTRIKDSRGNLLDIDWLSDGEYVYLDHPGGDYQEGVWLDCAIVADQHLWSANFSRGVQLKLEAVIAKGVKEETADSNNLEAQAEVHFDRARTLSSQERAPRPAFKKGGLSRARSR